MKVIYFDKYGQHTELETISSERIEIPIIARYNANVGNVVCQLAEDKSLYKDMSTKQRKKAEQFIYYHLTLVHDLDSPTNVVENWHIEGSATTEEIDYLLKIRLQQLVEWFVKTYCIRSAYEFREPYSWMGETYYYHNALIDRLTDTKACLLGSGHIFANGIRNCILYVYGNYDIYDG